MAKIKFELNLKGLNELMKSPEMVAALDEAGSAVANNAGDDYGYRTHQASYVAICNVYPESYEAAQKNYKDNTLLKALGTAGLSTSK